MNLRSNYRVVVIAKQIYKLKISLTNNKPLMKRTNKTTKSH